MAGIDRTLSKPKADKFTRYWEVDALRGIAIVEMVFFHFIWDLAYFGLYQVNPLSGPWQFFARNIASTFIGVMGLSLTLSYTRARPPPCSLNFCAGAAKSLAWGCWLRWQPIFLSVAAL